MPIYKVTWEFQSNNGAQWSEIYYAESEAANFAAIPGITVLPARLNLLHNLNSWIRTRASNIAEQRDTAERPINLSGTAPAPGGPAVGGLSVICVMGSDAGGTRRLWLRGAPSAWILRSGVTGADNPAPGLIIALGQFFTQMEDAEYGLLRRLPVGQGAVAQFPVIKIDGSAGQGYSVVTTQNPHNLGAGSMVYMGKFSKKDLPALQGSFVVGNPITATTFTILYQTPNASVVNVKAGYAKLITYTGVNIFDANLCVFENFGTRATRVPLFASRGARRAQRLRPSL